MTALDAGLYYSTGAPTVSLGDQPGDDIRTDEPVANAAELFATARRFGKRLPDAVISIGETIPGGTTTAMAVLTALGERSTVSSSLAHNPLALKREVINEALRA
ncbi:MAG: TIGR00303 family protein, partial [Euryarchaeota archaeon]|nr:TIGR00303 family protein [Euryarchaeota archaeon]